MGSERDRFSRLYHVLDRAFEAHDVDADWRPIHEAIDPIRRRMLRLEAVVEAAQSLSSRLTEDPQGCPVCGMEGHHLTTCEAGALHRALSALPTETEEDSHDE